MPSDVDEYPLQPTNPTNKTEPKSEMQSMPGHLEKWKQKPELLQATDSGSMYALGNPLAELGLQKNRKSKPVVGHTRNGIQEMDVIVPSASVKVLQSNSDLKPSGSSFVDDVVSSFRGGILARISVLLFT